MKISRLSAFLILAFLVVLGNTSCKKQQDCPTEEVSFLINPPNSGFFCLSESIIEVGQIKNYVINSEAEYAAISNCPNISIASTIDFSTSTLLIGKINTPYGASVVAQRVTRSCDNYAYTVKVQKGLVAVVSEVIYHVIIPKISGAAKVTFDVQQAP